MNIRRYIGDKKFYRSVLKIVIPMIIQTGISNFVSLLDNIMVGQLGTESISSVSIVNNIVFVFYLLIIGGLSGVGIFTAQYHGNGDTEGVRHTFRFKIIAVLTISLLGILAFLFFDDVFISLFLHESESTSDILLTLEYAKQYLAVITVGLIPYSLSCAYASTLRETGNTVIPMVSSVAAVFANFVLNYVLIFGHFGAPALGVLGAGIATTISRFVELAVLVIWTHTHKKRCPYIRGAYSSFYVPAKLAKSILIRGVPLFFNEFLWSMSVTITTQSYSTRGLDAVAALNISTTVGNLFNVMYLSIGSSIAIIVGNLLGASKIEEAKDTDRKLITFSVLCTSGTALLLAASSGVIPLLYNTPANTRSLATAMMLVIALVMPFSAFAHATFFTIRSGGKVLITMLFDSVFAWAVAVPVAVCLANFTDLAILPLFIICHSVDALKAIFGAILLSKVKWAHTLVDEKPDSKSALKD